MTAEQHNGHGGYNFKVVLLGEGSLILITLDNILINKTCNCVGLNTKVLAKKLFLN